MKRGWIGFLVTLSACAGSTSPVRETRQVTILALTDFHGWLSPLVTRGSTRALGGLVNFERALAQEGLLDDRQTLLLDNGDMWTGPSESTLLAGAPVVAAYNLLGVDAANLGNHEFDFGRANLIERAREAKFPLLSANLTERDTGRPLAGLAPQAVFERRGVRIGVLALAYVDTPKTTHARNVRGLVFAPYREVLERALPALRAQSDVVVLLLHDTAAAARALLEDLPKPWPDLVVTGQNHLRERFRLGDTWVVTPGAFGRSYARYELEYDLTSRRIARSHARIVPVSGSTVAAAAETPLGALIAQNRAALAARHREVLTVLPEPLPRGRFDDSPLGHFITRAWLDAVPEAQFAILNFGALRQSLDRGPVSIADVISVLPFENEIYLVELTAEEIADELGRAESVLSGAKVLYAPGTRRVDRLLGPDGAPLSKTARYSVLVNDFMYRGGDGYRFEHRDPRPYPTGLSIRDPVLRSLRDRAAER